MAVGARPQVQLLLQSACTSMCRHIYNWNIVPCDVKQPISLSLSWYLPHIFMKKMRYLIAKDWLKLGKMSIPNLPVPLLLMCVLLIAHLWWLVGSFGSHTPVWPYQLDSCCYTNWPSLISLKPLCNRRFWLRFCVVFLLSWIFRVFLSFL